MRFTIDDKHIVEWMWVKQITRKKRFLKMFLTEDEAWLGKKLSVRDINFVDLCSGVGIVWSTTTWTLFSDATAVTFSVNILTH